METTPLPRSHRKVEKVVAAPGRRIPIPTGPPRAGVGVRVLGCHPAGLHPSTVGRDGRRPRPHAGGRRRRPRGRATGSLAPRAGGLPPGHPPRPRRLRARDSGREGDPGRPPRHPGHAGRGLCRSFAVRTIVGGPVGRVGPGGSSGRHGQRGHRPGGALSLDRALLLGPRRPGSRHCSGHGLQRLAVGLLRGRSGPVVRRRHASHAGPSKPRRASCAAPSWSSGSGRRS